jgi:hypothetical protein
MVPGGFDPQRIRERQSGAVLDGQFRDATDGDLLSFNQVREPHRDRDWPSGL